MRAVLTQMELNDCILRFEHTPASWIDDVKKRKNHKALTQIHLHLSNTILQDVMKEKTSASLWAKLKQIYMKKSLPSKMHLKQHLYSHRMVKGTSLEDHLTVFKDIVSDLESMELKVEDEDLALILLCSLPPSYRNFVQTLLYSREKISLEGVFEVLYSKKQDK